MAYPKSPTPGKGKEASLTPKMTISRGKRSNSSDNVRTAKEQSVRTSRSQQTSPTRDRSLDATCGQADRASSNSVSTANQVRQNATTNSQQASQFENIISGCIARDSAFMTNNIILDYSEKSWKCIQDLKVTSPFQDRAKIVSDHSKECEKHLRKVCEHESYKRWRDEDEITLLWIHTRTKQTFFKSRDFRTGDQKRIVAAAVAEELRRSMVARDSALSRKSALSYMFCENKLNDTATILRGLMWLLTRTQRSLTAYLEETYKEEGDRMYTDEHAKRTLSGIFSRWLKDTNASRVYLVVGAIDECYMERKDILNFLDLIITCCKDLPKVKWLITSDWDDIYINYYIKPRLDGHRTSFETIHLNERSKMKEPREGRASDAIPGENVEKYVGEFFKGAAGDKKNETPEVSSQGNGTNPKRATGSNIPDDDTPPLPPSPPLKSGESTPIPQQGEQGNLNTLNDSSKRGGCVFQ